MKFFSMLAIITPALATPVALPAATAAPVVEKRLTATTCHKNSIESARQWEYTIEMAGWGNNDETSRSGCGTGLLDNLRGQCGDIIGWGCDEVHENAHDTRVHFRLSGWVVVAPVSNEYLLHCYY